jgi:hypothetical protein
MSNIKIANERELKKEMLKAIKFYEDFHWGLIPDKIIKIKAKIPPDRLVGLGYLRAVVYEAIKGDSKIPEMFFHPFEKHFPILASDEKGQALFVCGGNFYTNADGIIN